MNSIPAPPGGTASTDSDLPPLPEARQNSLSTAAQL
jgi:hypothetical protein